MMSQSHLRLLNSTQVLSFEVIAFVILYEGCSLILVIDPFFLKPASVSEENYLIVKNRFFTISKPPVHFKMIQLIIAN